MIARLTFPYLVERQSRLRQQSDELLAAANAARARGDVFEAAEFEDESASRAKWAGDIAEELEAF